MCVLTLEYSLLVNFLTYVTAFPTHFNDEVDESRESMVLDLRITDLQKKLIGQNEANEADLETLHDLGIALHERFEQTSDLSDLEQAISNLQQAVSFALDEHADK